MDNQKNLILNPHFALWPYGTTKNSSADARMAACWLWELGSGNTVTVSKQTAPSSTKYVKWIRSQECLEIDITSLTNPSDLKIYQKIYSQRFDLSRTLIRCTIIASGPVGESFYFGINGEMQKLQMLGDSGSPPIARLVSATTTFAVSDLASERIEFTAFENPSSTGKFYIYMLFAAVGIGETQDRINHRSDAEEWDEMAAYITPIKKGMIGYGASTTQIRIPVQAINGGWIRNPQIPDGATLGTIDLINSQTAASVTHTGATYSISVAPPQNNYGCSLVVGGLTGITAGVPYIIGNDTICFLETAYES